MYNTIIKKWVINFFGISDKYTMIRIKDELLENGFIENKDYTECDIVKKLREFLYE